MNHALHSMVLAALLGCTGAALAQSAGAVKVEVRKEGDRWQLVRGGQPYFIKGAAGNGSLEALAAAGANSTRTWDADDAGKVLDEAQRRGMTVCVGIWLGHERHGFNYSDAEQVAKQVDRVRTLVMRYKDHPAVLAWGLGNEMEGSGDNAAIWSHIESLASMVKALDPAHPTMTIVAELGGNKIRNLHRLCPSLDIVGINSYGGCSSVPKRYKDAGGTKPYVVCEFGPLGTWEVPKTAWGAVVEPTSTEKAAFYRQSYLGGIAGQPQCLGSYAFIWGNKQEATATWFGMLLTDGTRLGAVDTMTELWTGKPPASRCPTITNLDLAGGNEVDPGATVVARLTAAHPDGLPITVKWVLQPEADRYLTGGDAEAVLPSYPEAIVKAGPTRADVKPPADPGGYRLYAYVRDGKRGGAVANIALRVKGEVKAPGGGTTKLPAVVYAEAGHPRPLYFPSGWMGNSKAVKMQEDCPSDPHSGKTCLRFEYSAPTEWAGVVWQHPADDWGDRPGGWNLAGAKRLAFWARGEKGGEVVSFEFGLLGRDKKVSDTAGGKLPDVRLSREWREYSIDVAGKDLTRIKTGFAWTVAGRGAPIVFYLDDIRFE